MKSGTLLAIALLAAACGDDTLPVDSGIATDTPPVVPVAFAEVHTVLAARCAFPGCHSGSTAPGGLDMATPALAHLNLVNAEAAGPACGGMGARVVPGDPDSSIFYSKIADVEPLCGSRMPLGGRALSADEIDLVRRWILSGAQR